MFKKCGNCKYCYIADLSDVSGARCEKYSEIKITNLEQLHFYCMAFRFSILKFLFGV